MSKSIHQHFWRKYREEVIRKKTRDFHVNVFADNERPHSIHFTDITDSIQVTSEQMRIIGKFLIETADTIDADPDFNRN